MHSTSAYCSARRYARVCTRFSPVYTVYPPICITVLCGAVCPSCCVDFTWLSVKQVLKNPCLSLLGLQLTHVDLYLSSYSSLLSLSEPFCCYVPLSFSLILSFFPVSSRYFPCASKYVKLPSCCIILLLLASIFS